MSQYGDSLLVISDDEVVKVHIHSEQPGNVFNYGQRYGSLIKMKIENMREQHTNIVGETHNAIETRNPRKDKGKTRIWNCCRFHGKLELPIF